MEINDDNFDDFEIDESADSGDSSIEVDTDFDDGASLDSQEDVDLNDLDDDFLSELDALDSNELTDPGEQDSSSLAPPAAAKKISGDGTSENDESDSADNDAQTDKNAASDDKKGEKDAKQESDELSDEEEKYINRLPKPERQQARQWHKASRMQTTFLNPQVPAQQWAQNLKNKSEMRYQEVANQILKESSSDPVDLLDRIYENTQDTDGYSETYAKLLETAFDTNPDYFKEIFKGKNLELVPAGTRDHAAEDGAQSQSAANGFSSEETDAIAEEEWFKQLQEYYPEQAEKLLSTFEENARLKSDSPDDLSPEGKQAAEEKRLEAEKEATAAQAKEAEIVSARLGVFSESYAENVTNFVDTKLSKDYALEVTEKERAANPTMAFLKEAKRAVVMNGFGSLPEFDEGLKEWAKDKPAFMTAAESAAAYARALEKNNAADAMRGMQPFADLYLKERLKAPEIKLIDQVIQIVAAASRKTLRSRTDFQPNDLGGQKRPASHGDELLQEIDDMR